MKTVFDCNCDSEKKSSIESKNEKYFLTLQCTCQPFTGQATLMVKKIKYFLFSQRKRWPGVVVIFTPTPILTPE